MHYIALGYELCIYIEYKESINKTYFTYALWYIYLMTRLYFLSIHQSLTKMIQVVTLLNVKQEWHIFTSQHVVVSMINCGYRSIDYIYTWIHRSNIGIFFFTCNIMYMYIYINMYIYIYKTSALKKASIHIL